MKVRIQNETERQLAWYQANGGLVPPEHRRALLLPGTNGHAVLVLHGFTASPDDMSEITSRLNQAGFTVYAPLLTGFGASPTAANNARIEDWQKSVATALETLGVCHSEVAVVGHSLGGALALEATLSPPTAPGSARITQLALLAPYLRTRIPGMNLLNDLLKNLGPTIDLRLLKFLMQLNPASGFPLPIPPSYATDEDFLVPLQAVESALDFQKRFMPATGAEPLSIPVYLAISTRDIVVDSEFAHDFVASKFAGAKALVIGGQAGPADLFEDGKAHFLQHRSFNPQFDEMIDGILALLK